MLSSFLCLSLILGLIATITKKSALPTNKTSNFISVGKNTMTQQLLDKDGIGYIELNGVISSTKSYDIFGYMPSTSEALADAFEYYSENAYTKAIVISINSPGGSVVACDEAYSRMKKAKDLYKKPVVVVFRDIAASGGYYLAMIGDEIYASEGTLTGSIGVILQTINFKGLMDEYGVKSYSFVTGTWKDALSPYRDVNPEEEQYFNELVMSMLGNFTNKILDSRGDRLIGPHEELFDGRIFSGILASEFGLIDGIGTVDDAIIRAAELAKLDTEDPYMIPYEPNNKSTEIDMIRRLLSGARVLKNIAKFADIKSDISVAKFTSKYQGLPMYLYPNALVME